jgi:CubicO group peptidase (beta-lactamase class C family)
MTYDDFLASEILSVLRTGDMATVLTPVQRTRVPAVLARTADGGFETTAIDYPAAPDFRGGGGSIYATPGDYMDLQLMLLNGGTFGNRRLLSPESVAEMIRPQTGGLENPTMESFIPFLSEAVEFEPGMSWGFGMVVNREPGLNGRGAMSGWWAGLFNTYFWVDPSNGVAAGLYLQLVPFCDPPVVDALRAFERAVYRA